MPKKLLKRLVISFVAILIMLVLYETLWSTVGQQAATTHLRDTYAAQILPLQPVVNNLLERSDGKNFFECDQVSHSHTRAYLYCQDDITYKYDTKPLPAGARSRVIAAAAALDQTLSKNGWVIDRPQDTIQTVQASIPTAPLADFHVGGVPFHKNVGNISCNFEVDFGGPTDGVSPGVITINKMYCQQDVSYPMLFLKTYVNKGFGG